mgnify:CR=1 FL=1
MSTEFRADCSLPSILNQNKEKDFSTFDQTGLTSELFEICKKYGIDLNQPAQPNTHHFQPQKDKAESENPSILNEQPSNISNMRIEVEKLPPSCSVLSGLLSPLAPTQSTGSKSPLFSESKAQIPMSRINPYVPTPNNSPLQNRFNSSKETVKYAKVSELPRPRTRCRTASVSKSLNRPSPFEGVQVSDERTPNQPYFEYNSIENIPVFEPSSIKQKETVQSDFYLNVLLNKRQPKIGPSYQSTKTDITSEVSFSETTRIPTITTSESEVSGHNLLQATKEIDFRHFNSIQNEDERQVSKKVEILSELDQFDNSVAKQKRAEIEEIEELIETFTKESRPQLLVNPLRKKLRILQKELEDLVCSRGANSSNICAQKTNLKPVKRSNTRGLTIRSQSESKVELKATLTDKKSDIEDLCFSIKQKHRLIREQKENNLQFSSLEKQLRPTKLETSRLFDRIGIMKLKEDKCAYVSAELLHNELSFCGKHPEHEYELINNLR